VAKSNRGTRTSRDVERRAGTAVSPRAADVPARRNPAVIAAFVTAALAVVAAVPPAVGTVAGALISKDPPNCVAVLEKYDEYIGSDTAKVVILTAPGPDKKSPLEADADAVTCGIDAETLAEMAKTP
jgi:hypothetical protein